MTLRDVVPYPGVRVACPEGPPIMLKTLATGTGDFRDGRGIKVVVVGGAK